MRLLTKFVFLCALNSFSNPILRLLQDPTNTIPSASVMAQVESDSNDVDSDLSNFLYDEEGKEIFSSESRSDSEIDPAIQTEPITPQENTQIETATVPEITSETDSSTDSESASIQQASKPEARPAKPRAKKPSKPKSTNQPSGTRRKPMKPTTKSNKTSRAKVIRIPTTDADGSTKPKRTPKSTIYVPTMIVTDRRGVPRRITLTTPSTRGSTFTFPPWFYNSSYTFPEYSGEEDIPAIYKGQTTTLFPDISESMDEYSYFTTMNAQKRKRSEMKRLFSWPIPTRYSPFYEWYYNVLKDISGRNRRMEGAEHLLIDVNYSEEKPSTPFLVPDKLLNYFLYVNKMNKVLKLKRHWR